MKSTMTLLVPLLALIPAAGWAAELDWRAPVRVGTGLLLGVVNRANDVVAFEGIPYAAPPVGPLRWREPQPPTRWEGVRRADRFGASCMQPPGPSGKQPAEMSEDCLFLNVWTPARRSDAKLAVLFYIHGGAGFFGSGNINAEGLASKGIIVVSVNYRLGIFAGMGHPQLTDESPHRACGNYGMLDLIAALRWVQTNIEAFGGDPGKVTIAGQSSGANAVHYLMTSPLAKGLFRGAIAASFPCDYLTKPHSIPLIRQKEENGVAFARIKNARTLDDLRKIPALELAAEDRALASAKLIHLPSSVARDGWAFPLTYVEALDKGLQSDVPTLIGITTDDFGPPARSLKTTVATFADALPAMFGENRVAFATREEAFLPLCAVASDAEAREMNKRVQIEYRMCSLFAWARRRARTAQTPVYTYLFDHAASAERGAYHGSDLAYAFNADRPDRPWTAEDRQVADLVSSYWANFVRTGNPNGNGQPIWQAFDADRPVTMTLGIQPGPRPIAAPARIGFYRGLLER